MGLHGMYKAALEKADRICKLLASVQPQLTICHGEDMQGVTTVMAWLWHDSPFNKYTRARA